MACPADCPVPMTATDLFFKSASFGQLPRCHCSPLNVLSPAISAFLGMPNAPAALTSSHTLISAYIIISKSSSSLDNEAIRSALQRFGNDSRLEAGPARREISPTTLQHHIFWELLLGSWVWTNHNRRESSHVALTISVLKVVDLSSWYFSANPSKYCWISACGAYVLSLFRVSFVSHLGIHA